MQVVLIQIIIRIISISMNDQIYKAKSCAFHPKELIFNFCKNSQCLLPLCPSCIRIHTDEHRTEQTYGLFQNMHKIVGDTQVFFDQTVKELSNCCEEIKEQQVQRGKEQEGVKKKIQEAKTKMLTIVERFFSDFEKEVAKSIVCYNESMKENYTKVTQHIEELKKDIKEKSECLGNDKVLKVVIGFQAKEEEKKYNSEIESIKSRIEFLGTQKVEVVSQPLATQSVIEEMGNYIHLSFQNWTNQIKYVAEFVKNASNSTTQPFQQQAVKA